MADHPRRPYSLIEAPTNLGLKPPVRGKQPGVRRMPDALKAAGIMEALQIISSVCVEAPPYVPDRDPVTRVRNLHAIPDYSLQLAQAVGQALDSGTFPIVLGGDCTVTLGTTLALRERGRYGLMFIDGHCDYLTPTSTGTGGAAGMDLALACGVGPDVLTNLKGLRPYTRNEDVVILADHDITEDDPYPEPAFFKAKLKRIDLDAIRDVGIQFAANTAIKHMQTRGVDGYWIHVDVDVLSSYVMPAVDSPSPVGLTYAELTTLLQGVVSDNLAVGIQFTIFDPDLDPRGRLARELVQAIAAGLSS